MSEECFIKSHNEGNKIFDNLKNISHVDKENPTPIDTTDSISYSIVHADQEDISTVDTADTASRSRNIDNKDCTEKTNNFENIEDVPILQLKTTTVFSDNEDINNDNIPDKNVEHWTLEMKLHNFLQWCSVNGLKLSPKVKVDFNGTSHRYGMLATEEIKKGEVLFTVPRKLLLNQNTATLKNRLNEFETWLDTHGKSLNDSSGWLPLLITLMWEFNQKDSFWASYLRLVPEISEFGHPLFWTEEEYNIEFRGMPLLNEVIVDRENIETEYAEFVLLFLRRNKDLFGSLENYNLEFFKRMVAFVMAYSFTEDEESPSMVPMADILNHHSNNNAHLVFHKSNLQMISIRKIKQGEEVFNTFGKLGNTELLQMYGYVEMPSNQYDSFLLPVKDFYKIMTSKNGTTNDDPYLLAKINLLNRTGIAEVDSLFMFDRNGLRSGPDLIQFLKIFHSSDRELEKILKTRASKRPDSFYHKLLRKLLLSKKTEKNSLGVTVIDITEDDTEVDVEHFNKRKHIQLEDTEISRKRPLLSNSLSSCQFSDSNNCSVIELDMNIASNTIEIIESDEESDKIEDECCNDKTEIDLQSNSKSGHFCALNSDQNNLLRACEEKKLQRICVDTALLLDTECINNELDCRKKIDLVCSDEENKQTVISHIETDSSYNEEDSIITNCNEEDSIITNCNKEDSIITNCNKEDSIITNCNEESSFITNCNEECSIETDKTSITDLCTISKNLLDNCCVIKSDSSQISIDMSSSSNLMMSSTSLSESYVAESISNNGPQQTVFDVDSSTDESEEDIEFVESFPFSLSYEKLKELIKPEWKETILFVLDVLDKNMKSDENITQPNDLPRNLRNAFYVREGQRIIINLFKSYMT